MTMERVLGLAIERNTQIPAWSLIEVHRPSGLGLRWLRDKRPGKNRLQKIRIQVKLGL
jgi:hypothetical protein